MAKAKKVKVSVTISGDLLSQIDAYAARTGTGNRSNVVELWLRRAAREQSALQLEKDTIDYYDRLREGDVADDRAWAEASSDEFARLDLD